MTVQPLPCPAAGAMCSGSNGLSKRLNLTVSGVTGPPEAPGHVTVEPIDYHEDGGNDLRVSFDLDPVGVDYLIQWQRAGKAWASPGEREGWRGQKRTGRDSDVIFDLAAAQAYDVRVRWENERGPGPWTTVYNVGGTGQGSNRGAPEVERIERHGDKVWIFFDRDLDTGVAVHNKLTPRFGVHYSESAPAGLPDTLAGHSVNLTEIVKTRDGSACTSNGQACRIVRLTLNPVIRGGTEYDGPSDGETVSVSYWKSYEESDNLRAAGEWHSVPHVAEFQPGGGAAGGDDADVVGGGRRGPGRDESGDPVRGEAVAGGRRRGDGAVLHVVRHGAESGLRERHWHADLRPGRVAENRRGADRGRCGGGQRRDVLLPPLPGQGCATRRRPGDGDDPQPRGTGARRRSRRRCPARR